MSARSIIKKAVLIGTLAAGSQACEVLPDRVNTEADKSSDFAEPVSTEKEQDPVTPLMDGVRGKLELALVMGSETDRLIIAGEVDPGDVAADLFIQFTVVDSVAGMVAQDVRQLTPEEITGGFVNGSLDVGSLPADGTVVASLVTRDEQVRAKGSIQFDNSALPRAPEIPE